MKLKDLAVKHAYYCSTGNYFSNECTYRHETFADFMLEMGECDLDYNLLFRWDVKEHDAGDYEDGEAPEGFYAELFFMQQRKGKFVVCTIDKLEEEDVAGFVEYLKPRHQYMKDLWEPLS
jgi:hypothetical protein